MRNSVPSVGLSEWTHETQKNLAQDVAAQACSLHAVSMTTAITVSGGWALV